MRGERSAGTSTAARAKQASAPARVPQQESGAREEPLLDMQQQVGNREMTRLLGGGQSNGSDRSESGNGAARTKGATAEDGANGGAKADGDSGRPATAEDREARAEADAERERTAGPAFTPVVEDDVADVGPEQMRKSEFLEALRASVCASADEAMAGTGYTSMGCPYIGYWIAEYQGKSVAHLERAIPKFAPEAAGAATASKVIALLTARVRRSVDQWARTGEITGLPDAVPAMLPGAGMFGGVFFKARPGGAHVPSGGARAIRTRLGPGRALDGQVRGRMEQAFGVSFARVRLHTGAAASRLSEQMNAHAFTVGRDVAFGAGRYHPGNPVGDALIAHELAHVVQQRSVPEAPGTALPATVPPGTASPGTVPPDTALAAASEHASAVASASVPQLETAPFEADADRSAFGAVARLWGGARSGLANLRQQAGPRLRSGLTLSRCSGCGKKEAVAPKAGADPNKCETNKDVDAVKKALKDTYGFRAVEGETGKCWTLPELQKVQTGLTRVPTDHRSAFKGVELRRVAASSCQGDASGCFKTDIKGEQQADVFEIPDQYFKDDVDVLSTEIARTRRFDLAGNERTTLPSEETSLHEAGHAFETQIRRDTALTLAKAQTAQKEPDKKLQAAIKQWNDTSQSAPGLSWTNPKEKAYVQAIEKAGRALLVVINPVNKAGTAATADQLTAAATSVKDKIKDAKKAVAARNAARKALPATSGAVNTSVESDQNANLTAAEALPAALEAAAAARKTTEDATGAQAASIVTLKLSKDLEITVSRRLAELVALINLKGVDIKNSGLSGHAKSHWPHDPAEVYATMYEYAITQPAGLRALDADVAAFFTLPIGAKGQYGQRVSAWISSHKATPKKK